MNEVILPAEVRFKGWLELDLDGESVLGIISNVDTDEVICVHVASTISEVKSDTADFLSSVYWDFDPELHIFWTSTVPEVFMDHKFAVMFAVDMDRFTAFEPKTKEVIRFDS